MTQSRKAARAIEEQLREDQQELEMRERKRKVEDAKKIRGIVHEMDKSKASGVAQCVGKDRTGMTTSRDVCQSKTGRSEVHSSPQMYTRVSRDTCLRETGKAPSRHDGRRLTTDNQGSPTCARRHSRRLKSCVVGDRHGHA